MVNQLKKQHLTVFKALFANEDIKRYLSSRKVNAMKQDTVSKHGKCKLFVRKADDRNNQPCIGMCRSIYWATERKRRALGWKSCWPSRTSGKLTVPRMKRTSTSTRRKLPVYFRICHEQAAMAVKTSKRRNWKLKDRCQHHLFKGMYRPDRHLP